MLMHWPDGIGTEMHLYGRARDLLTPLEGDPAVLAEAELHVVAGLQRDIQSVTATPTPKGLDTLVGMRAGGGNYRKSMNQALQEEARAGTPLYLLFDDVAGATLIAHFVFIRWFDEIPGLRERSSSL